MKQNLSGIDSFIGRFFSFLKQLRLKYVPDIPFVFFLSFITGILTGLLAFVLRWLIRTVTHVLTGSFAGGGMHWLLLCFPIIGILAAVVYQRKIIHSDISNGTDRVLDTLRKNGYRVPPSEIYSPIIASTFTLGFGGSAGSEGPIASTGAALGSNMGRLCGMNPQMTMILLGCGAGAGIAGIFMAPIGGVLFTLEVLRLELTTFMVLALVSSCLTSGLTAYVLEGCKVDIPFEAVAHPHLQETIWGVLLLGVVCGVYSVYYSKIMTLVAQRLHSVGNIWLRAIISGGALSVLIFLFPNFYGDGYDTLSEIVNGNFSGIIPGSVFSGAKGTTLVLILASASVALLKCFATSLTNNGGGVAGDFAPTLFAGCFLGLFIGLSLNALGADNITAANFALFGMAGVMAGAIKAPLMAIFLTLEMTSSYGFILPVTIVAAISFGIVRLFAYKTFDQTQF